MRFIIIMFKMFPYTSVLAVRKSEWEENWHALSRVISGPLRRRRVMRGRSAFTGKRSTVGLGI